MNITLSNDGFKDKPKIPGITYSKINVELEDLEEYIRKGHVLSANFKVAYPITQKQRTLRNFQSTSYVMIDMDDDVNCELNVLVDSLAISPTIAYSTFNHGIKGCRYRLLYFFDSQIENIEDYKFLYSFICRECNLNLKDGCGNNPVQACIGSRETCEYIYTGDIYNIDNLIEEENGFKEIENSNFEIIGQTDYILKEREGSNIQFTCPVDISKEERLKIYDSTFLDDYFTLSYKDILDKYRDRYEYLEKTPLPITDADNPVIILPDNYVEIRRYLIKEPILDSKGGVRTYVYSVRKLHDGEGRKRKIYTATHLRKIMIPGISFPHLLYCALFDLYYYCFNMEDPISKKKLYDVVMSAAKKPTRESLIDRSRSKKKYVANPVYCEKHGVSKSQAVADYKHFLKERKYAEIGSLFDLNSTYEENQNTMKAYGLEVSIKDLQRFRKENNLPALPRKRRKPTPKPTTSPTIVITITHDSGRLLIDDAEEVIRKSIELQPELWATPSNYLFPIAV